jgi:hypothetical protein
MGNLAKWFLIVLAGIGMLLAAFVFIYAPLRSKRLSSRYARFRAEYQSTHDALDAQFNQQDRVVNGLSWHYVDQGNSNGTAILFLHGLPEGWYSWSKFDNFDQSAQVAAAINRFVRASKP